MERHGLRYHELYMVFIHMQNRCYNRNDPKYKDYGARGITICDRWNRNIIGTGAALQNFINDMYPSYEKGLSIDRIDNDGDYEPINCKWSTPKQQVHNRRKYIRKCKIKANKVNKISKANKTNKTAKISKANKIRKVSSKKYSPQNRKYSTIMGKPIIGINIKDGNIINFAKIDYAETALGISHTNINKCCNNKRKSAGGYYWKYRT